jgi:hypothetical protein
MARMANIWPVRAVARWRGAAYSATFHSTPVVELSAVASVRPSRLNDSEFIACRPDTRPISLDWNPSTSQRRAFPSSQPAETRMRPFPL